MKPEGKPREGVSWWPRGSEPTVGALVDQHHWVCVGAEGEEPPVFLALARDPSGRLICVGLIVGDLPPWSPSRAREINAATLRGIRIPQLIAAAVRTREMPDEFGEMVGQLLDEAPAAGRARRPGPEGYDDEHFREVARAYRAALVEAPGSPTKWLSKRLFVSQATARRWVQGARARGYLGRSTPGRPGEQPIKRRRGKLR